MSAKAVYLRDLVEEVPESVPPPPPALLARVTSKTLPPPPPVPHYAIEQDLASLGEAQSMGRPLRGSLEYRPSGWYGRFRITIDGKRCVRRFSLRTHNKHVARRRLEQLAASLRVERKTWEPQKPVVKVEDTSRCSRESHPAEYASWKLARRRCTNDKDINWKYYGGRGIRFHEAWTGYHGFRQFMLDMGPKPSEKHVLGRKDKNGHIDPDNARWMLRKDVRGGVRKHYDTGLSTQRWMQLITHAGRAQREVIVSERNSLIHFEGIDGGVTPNEADELARHLICVADAMRRRRSVNDAAR